MQIKRSLAPNAKLTITFAGNENDPPEKQPRIYAKTLAIDSQRELMQTMGRLQETAQPLDAFEIAKDGLAICLTGWDNVNDAEGQPIPFGRDSFGKVFALSDAMDIMTFVLDGGRLTVDERKKSESQPS